MSDFNCDKDCTKDNTTENASAATETLSENESTNSNNEEASSEISNDDKTPKNVLRDQPSYNINNILNLGNESETTEDTPKNRIAKSKIGERRRTSGEKSKSRDRMLQKNVKNIKKRKWRPLWKLTNKERKKVYERELRRVQQDRDLLINAGAALAPHNTSDFIIRDHFGSPPNDDEINNSFQVETEIVTYDKEFEEVYENMHKNYFEKLSKYELVERYIESEDRIEVLEKRLKAMRERKRLLGLRGIDVDSELTKIEVFKDEINKLIAENDELYIKNEKIKDILMAIND